MKRLAFFISVLAIVAFSSSRLPAADDASAEYHQLYGQWKDAVADVGRLQAKLAVSTSSELEATRKQFADVTAKAAELTGKLEAAAEKAYLADNKNRELGDLLLSMAISNLRRDNYEEAQRLAKLLVDHKYPTNDPLRILATTDFVLMNLDEAGKILASLASNGSSDPEDQRALAGIQEYKPLWDREQKLRAAEAKADNLPRVKLHTSQGDVVVELFENEAPNTVANFISLVDSGFYNGTLFHRVLQRFMAQGGDPLSKDPMKNQGKIGTGDAGYKIPDEFNQPNHRNHFRGSLSMAHSAGANSASSQFFIMFAPSEQLDGKYTVFGRVLDGMDVVSKLTRIDPDHPAGATPDKIISAEVIRKPIHPREVKKIGG
jgi:cyclophilin family peptidyl-prolyl cis-trans isomerase